MYTQNIDDENALLFYKTEAKTIDDVTCRMARRATQKIPPSHRKETKEALLNFCNESIPGRHGTCKVGGPSSMFSDKIRNLYLHQLQKFENFPTKH